MSKNIRFTMTYIYPRLMLMSAALLICTSGTPLGAESYYVWIDEHGVTNYSEYRPEDYPAVYIEEEELEFGSRRNRAAPPVVVTSQPKAVIDPDRLVDSERKMLQAKQAKIRQSNCAIGKRNLAQLLAYGRVRVSDDRGENRVLPDEEKSQRTDQARQLIRDNCTT